MFDTLASYWFEASSGCMHTVVCQGFPTWPFESKKVCAITAWLQWRSVKQHSQERIEWLVLPVFKVNDDTGWIVLSA